MSRLNSFLKSKSGNVALTFALSIVGLLLAVGVAVDMVRANNARTMLQAAADAAVLAGGASSKTTEAEVKAIAGSYIAGNGAGATITKLTVTEMTQNASGEFRVALEGSVPTSFLAIAGISEVNVGVVSEVKRGTGGPLELALVLDTTGSMAGSKLDTLKTAAKSLASSVLAGGPNTKVGIVPFANYVNVGVSHRGESWLDVPADYTDPPTCYDTYPNATGCTTTTYTCYNDGVPATCSSQSCTDNGAPVQVCYGAYLNTWNGCVGSRNDPLNARIDTISTPYPGFLNTSCAPALTDLTGVKSDVDAAIDSLSAYGDTFIPGGLVWGWNLLDPAVPFTNSADFADVTAKGGKKAMVLMTDGANTLYEWSNGVHWSCVPDCHDTDLLTSKLCENVKASGIILYTVLFDVTDPKIETVLRDCATDPGKSFVAADAAALLVAFKNIGASLTQLRLSK